MNKLFILLPLLLCTLNAQKSNLRVLANEEDGGVSEAVRNWYGYEPAIYPGSEETTIQNEEGQILSGNDQVWYGYEPASYPEDTENAEAAGDDAGLVWYGYEPALYPGDDIDNEEIIGYYKNANQDDSSN